MKARLILVIILAVLLFSPSMLNFFSSDDWFHLRVSQISSFTEFLNFFSPFTSAQSTPFYRPLSTQTFYFVFQSLFGLNPVYPHIFFLATFTLILWQLYTFVSFVTKSKAIAFLSLIIYGFSVTNLPRLYFLSGSQELFLAAFTLLTLNAYLSKKKFLTYVWFVLALLSKETAIFIPIYLYLVDLLFYGKSSLKRLVPMGLINLAFLLLIKNRLFTHVVGDATYVFNFSPKSFANTFFWYLLWGIGAPEFLVDYISSGLRPIARFYTDFPIWSYLILGQVLLVFSLIIVASMRNKRIILASSFIFAVLFFIISLGPLLLLPNHKFTLEMAVPMVGLSLGLGMLINKSKKLGLGILIAYLFLNLSMNYLLHDRHYSITRGQISHKVYNFLKTNFPTYPQGSVFLFINDTPDYGVQWGSSRQIAHAINVNELFKVFYHDHNLLVYYDDFPPTPPLESKVIKLSTNQFLP